MYATLLMMMLSLLPASGSVLPADSIRVMRFAGGEMFPLPGVGAIVVKEGTSLRVQFVPPPENRPEKFRAVDLRAEDRIMLLNGKRVKTIAEIQKGYDAIPVGAETKLGIQRGEELLIAAYPKPDPKDLPQRKMQIITRGDGAGETEVLPAVGVVLAQKGKRVVISALLETDGGPLKGRDVKEGDAIVSINGTAVSTVRGFLSVFDPLAVGANVAWVLERNGKEIRVSFPRPQPRGGVIMRRDAP
jgi:S1-C subfamily serine protease